MAKSKVETKKELKHRAILQAAETLMAEKGILALNMDEVAAKAKIAKGTLYLYFKRKEDIIGALALKSRKLLLEAFRREVSASDGALDRLEGIIRANHTFLRKNALYYDLVSFYEVSERETETAEMQVVIEKIIALIVSIIQEGEERGELQLTAEPIVLAFSMWGMTVGLMQMIKAKESALADMPGLNEAAVVDNYVDVFLQGIKK